MRPGLLVLLALACSGEIGAGSEPGPSRDDSAGAPAVRPPGGSGTVPAAAADTACRTVPGEGRLRRLTRLELNNTFRDLLGDTSRPADALELEPQVGAFYNSYADLWVDKPFLDKYQPVALAVAGRAAARLRQIYPCAWDGAAEPGCLDGFVRQLGEKLFRQPVPPDRAAKLAELHRTLRADHGLEEAAVGLLQAMLLAPDFLYRGETLLGARSGTGDLATRAQYQVASQLSYTIWASAPDAELLEAARGGRLRTREQIGAQARRMLGRPAAREGVLQLFEQLLEFPKYEFMDKDAKLHPEFGPALVADMKAETRAFLGHVIFEGEGTLDALLTAPFSFLTPRLAPLYGVTVADPTRKTALPPRERAGLLTQAGLLAHLSPAAGTKPVSRGHFVLKNLLCTDLEPPPEAQQTLPEGIAGADATTRQRFELHTQRPECAACHLLIDPIGFGLEQYDAVGRFRTREGTRPIDARGVLAGTGDQDGPFEGGVELAGKLSRTQRLHGCFVTQLFRYAAGRRDTAADACALDGLRARFSAARRSIQELVVETVLSDALLERAPVSQK